MVPGGWDFKEVSNEEERKRMTKQMEGNPNLLWFGIEKRNIK